MEQIVKGHLLIRNSQEQLRIHRVNAILTTIQVLVYLIEHNVCFPELHLIFSHLFFFLPFAGEPRPNHPVNTPQAAPAALLSSSSTK